MNSETTKIEKNTIVNIRPEIVAIGLVNKFVIAVKNSARDITLKPIGISTFPKCIFNGTFHSLGLLSLNLKTTIAIALKVKLQITPNAYASPSMIMLPLEKSIVDICRIAIRFNILYVVPYFLPGFLNQSVKTYYPPPSQSSNYPARIGDQAEK